MKYCTYFKCFKAVLLKPKFISSVQVANTTYIYSSMAKEWALYYDKFSNKFSTTANEEAQGASLQTVVNALTLFAPLNVAEAWDNVGLLIEPSTSVIIKKIILTNDLTEDVMDEAIEKNANMIISYHPPIFAKINRITSSTWKERIIAKCFEHRIAVFSPHTSWDCVENGVADWLISALPVKDAVPIQGSSKELSSSIGSGRIAKLKHTLTLQQAVDCIKKHVNLNHVRLALAKGKSLNSSVDTIAVCPGSGTSVLRGTPADLYLTGEMGHHDVLDAVHSGINVVLVNHADSERGFLSKYSERLNSDLGFSVSVEVAERDKDPLQTV